MNDTNWKDDWKEIGALLYKREFRIAVYAICFLFGILMILLSVAMAKDTSGIDYMCTIHAQKIQCFGAVFSLVFGIGMVLELSKLEQKPKEEEK